MEHYVLYKSHMAIRKHEAISVEPVWCCLSRLGKARQPNVLNGLPAFVLGILVVPAPDS